MSSRATACAGPGPIRLPPIAPARTAAPKMAISRVRMKVSSWKLRLEAPHSIQTLKAVFTLIKRAASGQGFARLGGPFGHQTVTVSQTSARANSGSLVAFNEVAAAVLLPAGFTVFC